MGKRGPQPKPEGLKVISGTDRPDRMPPEISPDVPLVDEMPPPPDWINDHGVAEWNHLCPKLIELGMLPALALSQLGHLCSVHGRIVQMCAAGTDPPAAMYQVYRGLMTDLGITKQLLSDPADVQKPAANPFKSNRRA